MGDQRTPLRGVTIAGGGCFGFKRTARNHLNQQSKYFVTFKGYTQNEADKPPRGQLGRTFQHTNDTRVVIEVGPAKPFTATYDISADKMRYRDLVQNTTYFLYVRGHGRWLTHDRLSAGLCA